VTLTGKPFTSLIHAHGALFTAWALLFIVQTTLVANRRVAVHRRLGVAGAVLAAVMVVVGVRVAITAAARGAAPPGMDPLAFMAVPFFDMVLFTGLVSTALVRRRDKDAHKRLMLLAYVSSIPAAVARLPGVVALGRAGLSLAFIFIAAGVIYDLVSRRRVHPVYVWGGTLVVLSVPIRLAISGTPAWTAFAGMLTR
jgi:hypothetical protein